MSDEYKVGLDLAFSRLLTHSEIDDITNHIDEWMFDSECDEYTSKNGITCTGKIRLPSGPPSSASIQREARLYFDVLLKGIVYKGLEIKANFTNIDYPNFSFERIL